jgi:hypothetical protein
MKSLASGVKLTSGVTILFVVNCSLDMTADRSKWFLKRLFDIVDNANKLRVLRSAFVLN